MEKEMWTVGGWEFKGMLSVQLLTRVMLRIGYSFSSDCKITYKFISYQQVKENKQCYLKLIYENMKMTFLLSILTPHRQKMFNYHKVCAKQYLIPTIKMS